MPPVKNYFDKNKCNDLLKEAFKKSKDGADRPFAFGVGKTGAFLALDYRNEHSPEKMLKEIKNSEFKDKFVVGHASISGKTLNITTVKKKGSIQPKQIKEFLADMKKKKVVSTPVSTAVIDGKGADSDAAGPGQQKEDVGQQMRKEMENLTAELDKLMKDLA